MRKSRASSSRHNRTTLEFLADPPIDGWKMALFPSRNLSHDSRFRWSPLAPHADTRECGMCHPRTMSGEDLLDQSSLTRSIYSEKAPRMEIQGQISSGTTTGP